MPDTPSPLSSTVQITNQQGAIDALRAHESQSPTDFEAQVQAEAERQAALEFAKRGKLNPSPLDFDNAVAARLQALRSAAPQVQAAVLEAQGIGVREAQGIGVRGAIPTGADASFVLPRHAALEAGPREDFAPALAAQVAAPAAQAQERYPELAYATLYDRQAALAPTGTGSRYSSYQPGFAPESASASFAADREARAFAPDVEAPASFDLVAPPRALNRPGSEEYGGEGRSEYRHGGRGSDGHFTEGGAGGRGFGRGNDYGGGGNGGGGFGGNGFGGSSGAADDGPGWWGEGDAGAEYLRRKKQRERERSYRPDSSNEAPIEATYAEPDYIDSDARAYDTGIRGRFQQGRDQLRGGLSGLREAFKSTDMAFAVGFGAMQSLGGLTKAAAPAVAGEYSNPAQVEEQAATSALPLIGSIAGTLIGGRLGPAGALAGQFVGGSIGQTAEDLIDQYSSGHIYAQQKAGTALGEGRGGPEAVDEFVNALRGAATPAVKELADSMAALGKTGVVTPGAASTFGGLQFALGSDYSAAVTGTAHYLESSPALAGERVKFGQGTFTAGDLYAQSAYAYGHGDFEAGQNLAATATARNTPPDVTGGLFSKDWAKAAKELVVGTPREQKGGLTLWEIAQEDWTAFVGGSRPGVITPANQAKAKKEANRGQALYEDYEASQAAQALGSAETARAAGGMQLAQIGGAGAAQMRGLLPGLSSSLGDVRATYEQQIGRDTRLMQEYPHDAAIQQQGKTDIATLRAEESKTDVLAATVRKSVFQTGLQEEDAAFGLEEARGLLSGKSGDQLFKARYGRGAELNREAEDRNNPLSPAERAQMETQAAGIQYSAKTAAYSDRLQALDIGAEKAGLAVTRARGFDTPEGLSRAETGEIDAYKGKVAELSRELASGGLKLDDYRAKQSQLLEAQGHVSQATAQRRDERIANSSALDSAQMSIDTAGLADLVQVGGSAAIPQAKIDADYARAIKHDEAAVAAYAPGTVQRKQAEANLAQETAALHAFDDRAGIYTPDADTRIADIRGEGSLRRASSAFERSREAPYYDGGINTNPLTVGNALLGELTKDEARRTADFSKDTARRTALQASGKWGVPDEEAYATRQDRYLDALDADKNQSTRLQAEKMKAMFGAVPESIIGGVSSGMGIAVTPTAALSAYYDPSPITGHFGGRGGGLPFGGGDGGAAYREYLGAHGPKPLPAATSHPTAHAESHAPLMGPGQGTNGTDMIVKTLERMLTFMQQNAGRGGGLGILAPQGAVHASEQHQASTGRW